MELKLVIDIGLQLVDRLEILHSHNLVSILEYNLVNRFIKISNQQIYDLAQRIQKTITKIHLKSYI